MKTVRKTQAASTERKRPTDGVKEKIEHYKKIIDRKIIEISNSNNRGLNKSALAGVDLNTNERNSSHHSLLTNNKSKLKFFNH